VRNYLKFRAIHWHGHATLIFNPDIDREFYAIERDDDTLTKQIAFVEKYTRDASGGYTWTFDYPRQRVDWFLLLNKDKILQLVRENAQFFYGNFIPDPGFNDSPAYEDNCAVDDSPRSTFPTTLGTDGQRLKQNKSGTAGAALNYIGKLYFLTSNIEFKVLFDSLKAGHISTQEALAAANVLAHSR
jgi:hypothetical protein